MGLGFWVGRGGGVANTCAEGEEVGDLRVRVIGVVGSCYQLEI